MSLNRFITSLIQLALWAPIIYAIRLEIKSRRRSKINS